MEGKYSFNKEGDGANKLVFRFLSLSPLGSETKTGKDAPPVTKTYSPYFREQIRLIPTCLSHDQFFILGQAVLFFSKRKYFFIYFVTSIIISRGKYNYLYLTSYGALQLKCIKLLKVNIIRVHFRHFLQSGLVI